MSRMRFCRVPDWHPWAIFDIGLDKTDRVHDDFSSILWVGGN
jgi:hypothetical protein